MSKRDQDLCAKTAKYVKKRHESTKHVKRDMYLRAKRSTVCQKTPMCVCNESSNVCVQRVLECVKKRCMSIYAQTVKHAKEDLYLRATC